MGNLLQDLKQAIRSLRKSLGFAIAAIIVMALGIGANTSIFSVVNSILLRPLPYQEPDHLVQVWHVPPPKAFPGMTLFSVSPANFFDWKQMNHVFTDATIYGYNVLNLTGGDRSEAFAAGAVSSNFFSVLGTQPMIGRAFSADEDQPGHDKVVILSHALWRDRYGSDKSVIGRQIEFNGEPYTVIGVMGPNFAQPSFAQLWTPLALTSAERALRGIHDYMVIARLRAGTSVEQANAELSTISQALAQQYPTDNKDWGAKAISLREQTVGDVRPALLVLLAAVIFVLLIACANVANLLLARTLARRHEVAIRVALGASRRRLIQQILCESVVISLIGGAAGLILAKFGIVLIVRFLESSLPRASEIGLDPSVLVFTFVISIITGIAAGLLPAWRFAGSNASEGLKEGAGRSGSEHSGNKTRMALVVTEVALSLLLLVGAGLMVRTLYNLQHTNPGFDPSHVLTMQLGFSDNAYRTKTAQQQAMDQMLQNIRVVPGVKQAGFIDSMPLTGGSHQPIQAEGHPVVQMSEQPEVNVRTITPGYLESMAIPVQRGRALHESDTADRPGAVVISASMAKLLWPNEEAVGKHLTLTFVPGKVREVVGVVGDVKQDSMTTDEPAPTLYLPFAQAEYPAGMEWHARAMNLVVQSAAEPANVAGGVLNGVHQVDAHIPALDVLTMERFIGETLQSQRMNMLLLVCFAALALTLAAIGIYSVLAYSVRRRVREIGIRLALGAQVRDILGMILLQGMKPTLIGMVIGLALSIALGRAVASLVYGVGTNDVLTLLGGSLLILIVAGLASFIPAFRATRVEPAKILHQE
jgi:putative ABC transport system permease protein